jgi:hypothetical protein
VGIDPKEFDVAPLSFEENTDYGWTRIAKTIIDFDGKLYRYINQAKRNRIKVGWVSIFRRKSGPTFLSSDQTGLERGYLVRKDSLFTEKMSLSLKIMEQTFSRSQFYFK